MSEESSHLPETIKDPSEDVEVEQVQEQPFCLDKTGVIQQVRSLCMHCHGTGITKMLVAKIPMFKDVIVSSFRCDSCGWEDRSFDSATELAPTTITYELTVDVLNEEPETITRDMNRTIVRSQSATISIPELDFTIEAKRAEINTVEGLLRNVRESVQAGQEERRSSQPDQYEKLEEFIRKISMMEEGKESFTLVVDDVAGNSFVENPYAPRRDPRCKVSKRLRTREETVKLGYLAPEEENEGEGGQEGGQGQGQGEGNEKDKSIETEGDGTEKKNEGEGSERGHVEDSERGVSAMGSGKSTLSRHTGYKAGGAKAALNVMAATTLNKKPLARFDAIVSTRELQTARFHGTCHRCFKPNETRMCIFEIPYFQETVIMCTDCSHCGYRDSEIKPGGATADKGLRIELQVNSEEDLSRDVLKSDYAAVHLPDLELELEFGTLGGKFTTVEGVINDIIAQLEGQSAYYMGDSGAHDHERKERYTKMLEGLKACLKVETPYRFVLDDPAGQSFIEGRANGVPDSDPSLDPTIKMVHYTRTPEQDGIIGIDKMVTENYDHTGKKIDPTKETIKEESEGEESEGEGEGEESGSSSESEAEGEGEGEGEAEATATATDKGKETQ